jgi:hypothetical protein
MTGISYNDEIQSLTGSSFALKRVDVLAFSGFIYGGNVAHDFPT